MIKKGPPCPTQVEAGFTLVEILVVMAIVAILGTVLAAIFVNTLRGSNKSQILAVIKQNGQAVLENMDKTIRGSDNVICPSIIAPATSATADTLVVEKNGSYVRYRFFPFTGSSNGYIQQDYPVPNSTTEIDINVFLHGVCITPTDPLYNPVIITDTNPQSGVSIITGSFTRNRQAGFKDSVTVRFFVDHGVGAPAAITGQIDAVEFTTTIGLR